MFFTEYGRIPILASHTLLRLIALHRHQCHRELSDFVTLILVLFLVLVQPPRERTHQLRTHLARRTRLADTADAEYLILVIARGHHVAHHESSSYTRLTVLVHDLQTGSARSQVFFFLVETLELLRRHLVEVQTGQFHITRVPCLMTNCLVQTVRKALDTRLIGQHASVVSPRLTRIFFRIGYVGIVLDLLTHPVTPFPNQLITESVLRESLMLLFREKGWHCLLRSLTAQCQSKLVVFDGRRVYGPLPLLRRRHHGFRLLRKIQVLGRVALELKGLFQLWLRCFPFRMFEFFVCADRFGMVPYEVGGLKGRFAWLQLLLFRQRALIAHCS